MWKRKFSRKMQHFAGNHTLHLEMAMTDSKRYHFFLNECAISGNFGQISIRNNKKLMRNFLQQKSFHAKTTKLLRKIIYSFVENLLLVEVNVCKALLNNCFIVLSAVLFLRNLLLTKQLTFNKKTR